jgi:hypothetical protein
MPDDGLRTVDVLRYETPDGPSYRAIESGRGEQIVAAHEREVRKRRLLRWILLGGIAVAVAGYGVFVDQVVLGGAAAVVVLAAGYWQGGIGDEAIPELVERNTYRDRAAEAYDLDVVPEDGS